MSDISNISSILQDSLLLSSTNYSGSSDKMQEIQNRLENFPSILDKDSLTKLKNGEYDISLQEYTSLSTYNAMMTALYGDKSANKFQNTLNILTNSAEDNLATAKSFIQAMKENGMSNETALKTYSALQKYSILSSFDNYNFVTTKV